jgi:hypothetical protein
MSSQNVKTVAVQIAGGAERTTVCMTDGCRVAGAALVAR